MNALASLLTYAGLASLALAMPRHHRTVFQREAPARRRLALHTAGWLLLAASVAAAFRAHGAELGTVAWLAAAAAAGLALTLVLAYAPRYWLAPLVPLLIALALQ